MDRKAIIVITLSIALLFLWPSLFNRLYPPTPGNPTNRVTSVSAPAGTTNLPASSASTSAPGTLAPAASGSTNVGGLIPAIAAVLRPDAPEQTVVVSNALVRYTFTSHGGGIKSADLFKYPETVDCNQKDQKESGKLASLNGTGTVAAMSLAGDPSLLGDGLFSLQPTASGVRAEKQLPNDLVLVKDFQLVSNYLMTCTVRLENRSGQPRAIPQHEIVVGTAYPMDAHDDGSKVGFYWGRAHSVEHITSSWYRNAYLGCIPGTPRSLYQDGLSNVTWAAVHNQFFTMAAIPKEAAQSVIGRELKLPPPSAEVLLNTPNANKHPVAYQTSLLYSGVTIPPNSAFERQFSIYSGPKEYYALSRLGERFGFDLDQVMGFDQVLFGSFSGFFAKILLLAMNGLHSFGINYGLTIVVITVLIKLLFWPLTQASTRSMKRMQALQPQMKALQEKYKDDPAKLNKKMMEFWREHKVSPFGGCLPVLLQMPVFIGFFAMIQTAIELRGAGFLWACDLTRPDTLFMIPGIHFPFNLMPLLMGVTMFWQARLTPAAPGVDPMQANMMKYMPLMFLVMLYNFSSGLTLYWTVQNLLSILQMKLTKAQDEKQKAQSSPSAGTNGTGSGAGVPRKKS